MSTLDKIINDIKSFNDSNKTLLSEMQSSEYIDEILAKYNLTDDADALENEFGANGLNAIRDAESGIY